MPFDITKRRERSFLLWIPGGQPNPADTPRLVLGKWDNGFDKLVDEPLQPSHGVAGLWELSVTSVAQKLPAAWQRQSGVYIYWFKIRDTSGFKFSAESGSNLGPMLVTDPLAYALDYRVVMDLGRQPAAVIWMNLENDLLKPCDNDASAPASGTDIGTFGDVIGLFDSPPSVPPINGQPYLTELGINALELTPPADANPPGDDSGSRQEWGYATAHYFAPDFQLAVEKDSKSTAIEDLGRLIRSCHAKRVRFFTDVVLAFGHDPYKHIAFNQFHPNPSNEKNNNDSWKSSRPDHSNDVNLRDGWGGESWRYIQSTNTYDPQQGFDREICPASSFHLAHINRWISYYQIDGIRIDSVENVANWDFLRLFRDQAHAYFGEQYPNDSAENIESRFTVVGEELSVPQDLISSGTLDGYWNEEFKHRLRTAILGYEYKGDTNDDFETTVNKIVNCKLLGRGFQSGVQAVNYITSHDVAGDIINRDIINLRLYNYLQLSGVESDEEKHVRAKLAFAILLTSVGIPMILAGEEFCDVQDRIPTHPYKQVDPVDFERVTDAWRMDLFGYVKRLIAFRKTSEALRGDAVEFIDRDFKEGRKIVAWTRGDVGANDLPVVVVANFSPVDCDECIVNGWAQPPSRGDGRTLKWREVGEGQEVPPEKVGRDAISHWQAKVYECYAE